MRSGLSTEAALGLTAGMDPHFQTPPSFTGLQVCQAARMKQLENLRRSPPPWTRVLRGFLDPLRWHRKVLRRAESSVDGDNLHEAVREHHIQAIQRCQSCEMPLRMSSAGIFPCRPSSTSTGCNNAVETLHESQEPLAPRLEGRSMFRSMNQVTPHPIGRFASRCRHGHTLPGESVATDREAPGQGRREEHVEPVRMPPQGLR